MVEEFKSVAKEVAGDLAQGDSKMASARLQEEFQKIDGKYGTMAAIGHENELIKAMDKELANLGFPALKLDAADSTIAASGALKLNLDGTAYQAGRAGLGTELADAAHQAEIEEAAGNRGAVAPAGNIEIGRPVQTGKLAEPIQSTSIDSAHNESGAASRETAHFQGQPQQGRMDTSNLEPPAHKSGLLTDGVVQKDGHTFSLGANDGRQADNQHLKGAASDVASYPQPKMMHAEATENARNWGGSGYCREFGASIDIAPISQAELAKYGGRVNSDLRESRGAVTNASGILEIHADGTSTYKIDQYRVNGQVKPAYPPINVEIRPRN
jgi:hypothetical protein